MQGLRAGFVGLGWWGQELAAAAQRSRSSLTPVACFSPDAKERSQFAERFACRAAESYAALLRDPAVEAVVLATPHGLHADQIVTAAHAGRHVFVEKPLAPSAAEAWRAVAACREAGVMLAVGHNRRLLAQLDMMATLLREGVCGRLLHVEANFSTAEGQRLPPGSWRALRAECPGGAMTVLGVHVIDWLHVLFGPVAEVTARCARRGTDLPIDDVASALLAFESGLIATLTCLYAAPYTNRFVVHGTDATLHVEAAAPESESLRPCFAIRRDGGAEERLAVPYVDTLRLQLDRWAAACHGEGAVAVDGIAGARNIAVLEAIIRSAEAGGAPARVDYGEGWG